jgi:myosin heavy subunit
LHGATGNLRQYCQLGEKTAKNFVYLHDTTTTVNQSLAFDTTCAALTTLGVSDVDIRHLFGAVAAVLFLGNIDPTACDAALANTTLNDTEAYCALNSAAELLGLPVVALADNLRHRVISVGGETIKTPLSCQDFFAYRDSLAKSIYAG